MSIKRFLISHGAAAMILLGLSASAEMGMHWWPCSTARLLREYTKLVVFEDSLWSIGGTGFQCGEIGDGIIGCWPVCDRRPLRFHNCIEYQYCPKQTKRFLADFHDMHPA